MQDFWVRGFELRFLLTGGQYLEDQGDLISRGSNLIVGITMVTIWVIGVTNLLA